MNFPSIFTLAINAKGFFGERVIQFSTRDKGKEVCITGKIELFKDKPQNCCNI